MQLGLGLGLTRRGSGTAAFTPASLFAGTAGVWYDASDLSTMYQSGTRASPGTPVATDGDPVGLILDKSGNNNDATSSGAARPLYKTSGGLSWLQFDGVDDALSLVAAVVTASASVSATAAINQTAAQLGYIFGALSTDAGFEMLVVSGTNRRVAAFTSSGSVVGNSVQFPGTGVNYLYGQDWDRAGGTLKGFYNGGSADPSLSGTAANLTVPTSYRLGNNGAAPFGGRVYAFHLISRLLTTAEKAQLNTYLGAKAGLTL